MPVNRNDPCPCGSGRKYKKCCLGKQGPTSGGAAAAAPPLPRTSPRERLAQGIEDLRGGRLRPAEAAFRQVMTQQPGESLAPFYLGQVLGRLGNLDEGVRLHRAAIAIDDDRAEYHLSLADLLQQKTRFDLALPEACRAAALDPRNVSAHTLVAICHERLNDLEDAEAAARRALAARPDDANAGIVLAAVEGRTGRAAAARERLEAILAGAAGLSPFLLARALRTLGIVLDRLGEYDAAFARFEESGRVEAASPRARRIDRGQEGRRIAAYRAGVPRAFLERCAAARPDDGVAAPGFLVGFSRSGTTMTEQVLAAHPSIVSSDEVPLLDAVMTEMRRHAGGALPVPEALERLDGAAVRALRASYRQRAETAMERSLAGCTFIDKLPLNIVDLAVVNVLFPEAKVIVALRDPRDVCLSCFMQDLALNAANIHFLHLADTVRLYAEVMGLWLDYRERLTLDWIEIRYEDTVADLETQARRLLDHLGLGWDDGVLDFHRKAPKRPISTPSYAAVTERVHTRAIGRWKNYERHFAPLAGPLERFVEAFGYEREPVR